MGAFLSWEGPIGPCSVTVSGPGAPKGRNWSQCPGTDHHPQWALGMKALVLNESTEPQNSNLLCDFVYILCFL